MSRKAELWQQWIGSTLLDDISREDRADPVPFLQSIEGSLKLSDAAKAYKRGKNNGDSLYLLYLLDDSVDSPNTVIPIYIGESKNISQRLTNHAQQLRKALPTSEWADSGAWGSFSKYDHMALIYERTESPFYVWICDVDKLAHGPYGDETYRQELEAKLVGLVHAQECYEGIFTNREFVPNRVLHRIGAAGPQWVSNEISQFSTRSISEIPSNTDELTKSERWDRWITEYTLSDIRSAESPDPIPLFEVDGELTVEMSQNEILRRSSAIDSHIRSQGKKCVDESGVRENGCEGLLYVMYRLSAPAETVSPRDFTPLYIGKAEAYGKKRALSSNFVEIAKDRNATRSFARWGDGNYWHIGELSMAIRGEDERKASWVDTLFEPGTRQLREQTYLWVHAWDSEHDIGPYGVPATLAEVEPLLIGLAYSTSPQTLLNRSGTPDI